MCGGEHPQENRDNSEKRKAIKARVRYCKESPKKSLGKNQIVSWKGGGTLFGGS